MKEIGQYFKERFEQFEPNPPADFWSKIQNDKAFKRFNRKQSFHKFLKFGLTPAAVVVIAILFWISSTQKENTLNQVVVKSPQPNMIVSQQVPNSERQQEHNLKTDADIVNQETNYKKKSVENKIDKNTTHNIESIKNSVESTISPISNNPTIFLNNKVPIHVNNSLTNHNTPKENPKTSIKPGSNVTIKSDPIENNTSVVAESIPENVIEKNTSTNPEEEIDNLLIPNSFTPNGDGINDQFLVKAMWNVEEFEIMVYERSGNIVFKTNEIGMGWDGTSLGKEIHAGVYVYLIIYKDSAGNKQKTKGTLNLIR